MLRNGTGEVGGDKVRIGCVRVIVLVVLGNDRDGVLVIWIVLMTVNGVGRLVTGDVDTPWFLIDNILEWRKHQLVTVLGLLSGGMIPCHLHCWSILAKGITSNAEILGTKISRDAASLCFWCDTVVTANGEVVDWIRVRFGRALDTVGNETGGESVDCVLVESLNGERIGKETR